jgi:thiosulfate reductase cytochrome b subunit
MQATAPPGALPVARERAEQPVVYRHSVATRVTHWVAFLAIVVLTMSGLQIFNAAPYLDASDKSDPAHRVFWVQGGSTPDGQPFGQVILFGRTFRTTHWLGYTDDGMGGESPRAFPGWLTLPGYQGLADGRRWHLFFAWVFTLCGVVYVLAGIARKDLRLLILRPSDIPKLWPMQAYYLRLRKEPPPHGKYNPLQKLAYTVVLFVFSPLLIISGLALSPGVDAIWNPITTIFGGRQFARLWHFVFMVALLGFFATHIALVLSTGVLNNLRSITLGTYRRSRYEGSGP